MRYLAALVVSVATLSDQVTAIQDLTIGIIDFYGLSTVTQAQARDLLTFKEGDVISIGGGPPGFVAESEARLTRLKGVASVRTAVVCCDDEGRLIVFLGLQETGAPTLGLRAAPTGSAMLAADVIQAGDEFKKALRNAAVRRDASEDDSAGHALAHDPATRATQERFIEFAARDFDDLRRVLGESANPTQRALAAQVLAYAANKQSIVNDLVQAMSDPSEEVRNDAMRTLLVFARAKITPALRVPWEPFIALLHSPTWTDRNKASGALQALTEDRPVELLEQLRRDALPPLIEMARWKSDGHALAAYLLLSRIAGYSEAEAVRLWKEREREVVINAALDRR